MMVQRVTRIRFSQTQSLVYSGEREICQRKYGVTRRSRSEKIYFWNKIEAHAIDSLFDKLGVNSLSRMYYVTHTQVTSGH